MVSFPIVATGPGVVAAIWGVCLFKEVKGTRNITILLTACFVAVVGNHSLSLSLSASPPSSSLLFLTVLCRRCDSDCSVQNLVTTSTWACNAKPAASASAGVHPASDSAL